VEENIVALQKAIAFCAMRLGVKKIGFADLSAVGHSLIRQFPSGISLVLPMEEAIVAGPDEPAFFRHQVQQRDELEAVKADIGRLQVGSGYRFHSVSNDMDPERFTGELSHKMIANLAGLGWVGKSSLFVTPEYGPRIRLTSMLTDAPFSTRMVPLGGKCGECDLCASACPVNAIRGVEWQPGIGRDELLDIGLCVDYRNRLGDGSRRYSCARCLNACPIGIR
jgi:epoxyqueuosine reductase QueG